MQTIVFFAFNTLVEVKAWTLQEGGDAGGNRMEKALLSVRERCLSFEHVFSRTRFDSDIARINTALGKPIEVSWQTADLIEKALPYCAASCGLFDITMGTVTELWDFNAGVVPSKEEVAEACTHVDYRKVKVVQDTVRLEDPKARIDLGGIAKGYIADEVARLLREDEVRGASINLGGNVFALGLKPDGSLWRVGIRDPRNVERSFAYIDVTDTSVVTSGLYERSFTHEGVFYHHILDPKTGFPAQTDVTGVTILSPTSLDGDGFSTTAFLLGVEEGLTFIEQYPGLEAVIVDESGRVHTTTGVKDKLVMLA